MRSQGFAEEREEFVEGACGIAAPVFDGAGGIYGSLSISISAFRYPKVSAAAHQAVIAFAAQATRALADQRGAGADTERARVSPAPAPRSSPHGRRRWTPRSTCRPANRRTIEHPTRPAGLAHQQFAARRSHGRRSNSQNASNRPQATNAMIERRRAVAPHRLRDMRHRGEKRAVPLRIGGLKPRADHRVGHAGDARNPDGTPVQRGPRPALGSVQLPERGGVDRAAEHAPRPLVSDRDAVQRVAVRVVRAYRRGDRRPAIPAAPRPLAALLAENRILRVRRRRRSTMSASEARSAVTESPRAPFDVPRVGAPRARRSSSPAARASSTARKLGRFLSSCNLFLTNSCYV